MLRSFFAILSAAILCFAQAGADARRGADVFTAQGCWECHGSGAAAAAPDLNRATAREYTPSGMASQMWNHAPAMWAKIRAAQRDLPKLSGQEAADLFAFYYATRYFERPGDAGRGKRVFGEKKCIECHSSNGPALPAQRWKSIGDPIELAGRMWNHAAEMRENINAKVKKWPVMNGAEFGDLLVYVQNLPETRNTSRFFALPAGARGQALLVDKGCVQCHKGNLALEGRLGERRLTDIAASFWNHAPMMREKMPGLAPDEIREMIAYAWSQSFFRSQGNPGAGRKVFDSKCGSCHSGGGPGPDVKGKVGSATAMVSALWAHGPKMLAEAEKRGKGWPSLSPSDMDNLLAWLEKAQ